MSRNCATDTGRKCSSKSVRFNLEVNFEISRYDRLALPAGMISRSSLKNSNQERSFSDTFTSSERREVQDVRRQSAPSITGNLKDVSPATKSSLLRSVMERRRSNIALSSVKSRGVREAAQVHESWRTTDLATAKKSEEIYQAASSNPVKNFIERRRSSGEKLPGKLSTARDTGDTFDDGLWIENIALSSIQRLRETSLRLST